MAYAGESTPAQGAETMRSALFAAQMALAEDPAAALSNIQQAAAMQDESWFETVRTQTPASAEQLQAALDAAGNAVTGGDGAALAAARGQAWAALLNSAQQIVRQAVTDGDLKLARSWLLVREFRQATRFARPNADATLALAALERREISAAAAAEAIRADLYDTYQARLTEALRNVSAAGSQGFALRRAELAASAQGYFAILEPAYREQRGADAANQLTALLARLAAANLPATDLATSLSAIDVALGGFRAAPLLPAEQTQRAAQLLRYLKLVAVEYGRGVNSGEVTSDLEIREAVTFLEGARAAFDDLSDLLRERDAVQTQQIAMLFGQLANQINDAVQRSHVADPAQVDETVTTLDNNLQALMPPEWLRRDNAADFDVIGAALDNMEQAAASGDYALAESARVDAYAILESGPEARIQAFAPQFKLPLEELFWYGQNEMPGLAYLIEQKAPMSAIKASRTALDTQLKAAQNAISGSSSPLAIATNAFIIVFREGLEAVLILASLMASFKTATQRNLRCPMWWGVVAAGLASVLTWALAQGLLTSLARYGERLEAIVSLVAIGVLLLITNWFFHQNYWTDHIAGLHSKKRGLVGGSAGQWLGLATLGFTSVYREGFETVLFLQALVLEAGLSAVILGVLAGLGVTMLVGLVLFRMQLRLPYKKMLIVTGVFIGVVLLTMVGNTVHILQLVGWLPLHPIRWLALPYWLGLWFGVYSTWEGLTLQFVAAAFVIGSYYLAEHMQKRAQRQRVRQHAGSARQAEPLSAGMPIKSATPQN
ncbi:MAG: FTR1 family protein [Caldilineaceae bacterium]